MCIPAEPAPPGPECTEEDLSKCPGPPDKLCGVATCDDGVCGVKITPGPVASQKAGDCKQFVCNLSGLIVEERDLSDYYDDGAECTFDYCKDAEILNDSMHAISCPETGEGFCSEGACVQCIADVDCGIKDDCYLGHCLPKTCFNDAVDPTETDEDCGGDCLPCVSGKACVGDADCASNVCKDMKCQVPACDDNKKNDGEADTDCGAVCKTPPKPCGVGQGCETGADCESDVCWAGACQAATCTDGVQNAKETGIDCGGDCPAC